MNSVPLVLDNNNEHWLCCVLIVIFALCHLIFTTTLGASYYYSPIFQKMKLRHREVAFLAQDLSVYK